MSHRRFIQSESGMGIVSMILIVGMLIFAGLGITSLIRGRLQDEQQITLQQGAEMAKWNIVGTISQDAAWKATIDNEPNLACLRKQGEVCHFSNNTKIALYLADGVTPLVATKASNRGFDRLGNFCDTFDPVHGNDNCPFQYVLFVSCDGGTCEPTYTPSLGTVPTKPRLVINGSMIYKPKTGGQGSFLLANPYSFQVVRGAEERDLPSTCNSIGGYFDQGTNHCSIQSTNSSCDPVSQYMAGIDSSGKPICRNKGTINVFCPARYAVVGLDEKGRVECGKF